MKRRNLASFNNSDGNRKVCFDIALGQSLIINESECFILSHNNYKNSLKFLVKHSLLKSSVFAKLSLDLAFIAIQYSDTNIAVIDIKSKQTWEISIRQKLSWGRADDITNKILKDGIIWSEHGGTSQDLIIITESGLEFHKVSSKRNTCKCSRVISESSDTIIENFWYEPQYRAIVLYYIPATTNPATSMMSFFGSSTRSSRQL